MVFIPRQLPDHISQNFANQSKPKNSRVATSTSDRGKMERIKRAVPVVITELRTITAMINSTRTMEMVSAVYCQANPVEHENRVKELMRCLAAHRTIIRFMQVMILPRKKISAMKIDKL
jgi:hypothetical protein